LLTDVLLITCIVQRGLGDTIVHAAQGAGVQGATIFYAKGRLINNFKRIGLDKAFEFSFAGFRISFQVRTRDIDL